MSKQKHRDRGGQGLTVKERAGRRAFRYRVPPEVADRVPSGTTVTIVSLSRAEIFALARRVEPEVTRWLTEKPAKNALEALLLMVQAIYALLQPPELPVPYKEQVEIAYTLAPDEHILFVAEEVEKRLLAQMAAEGVILRDATQAGMLVVTMVHKMLFDQASIFGADEHEMHHIARVLVASHTFHSDWPYCDQVKAALVEVFQLAEE